MSLGQWGLATGVLTNPLTGWGDGNSSAPIKISKQLEQQTIDPNQSNAHQLSSEKNNVCNFVNSTLTEDFLKVQKNPSDGKAQSQLAADLATLHNLERQFFADAGNTSEVEKYEKNAGYTGSGNADDVLKKAGADKHKSSDYIYTLTPDGSGGYVQTALLKGEPSVNQGSVSTDRYLKVENGSGGL